MIVDRPTVGTTHKMVPNTETTDDVVGNNEHNKKESNTHNLFFFGTLMVPSILSRVLHHRSPLELKNIVMQPALLHGYTRLAVAGTDYPAIVDAETSSRWIGRELHESESSVEGVYVMGLTDEDAEVLDVFEGEVSFSPVTLVFVSSRCFHSSEVSRTDPHSMTFCLLPARRNTNGYRSKYLPSTQIPNVSCPLPRPNRRPAITHNYNHNHNCQLNPTPPPIRSPPNVMYGSRVSRSSKRKSGISNRSLSTRARNGRTGSRKSLEVVHLLKVDLRSLMGRCQILSLVTIYSSIGRSKMVM